MATTATDCAHQQTERHRNASLQLEHTAGSQSQLFTDGATSFINGPNGLPIEQIDGTGTPSYFVHDQLGSTRALLNQAGAVAANNLVDYNDPTGAVLPVLLGAGIGAINGAVSGAVGYCLDTLVFRNEQFNLRRLAAAAAGGFVGCGAGGACLVGTASPVMCGALGAQINELVEEGVSGKPDDPVAVISATVFGGLIPDPFPRVGARPCRISHLFHPGGLDTWRWYGSDLFAGSQQRSCRNSSRLRLLADNCFDHTLIRQHRARTA